jgi:hypothetical protein
MLMLNAKCDELLEVDYIYPALLIDYWSRALTYSNFLGLNFVGVISPGVVVWFELLEIYN